MKTSKKAPKKSSVKSTKTSSTKSQPKTSTVVQSVEYRNPIWEQNQARCYVAFFGEMKLGKKMVENESTVRQVWDMI